MPRSYTQMFLKSTVKVETEVTVVHDDVVVTVRALNGDYDSWHDVELFVPVENCAAIAQAFNSLAQELFRIAARIAVEKAATAATS